MRIDHLNRERIQKDIMDLLPKDKWPKKVHGDKISALRRFGVPTMTTKTKGPKLVHKFNHSYYTNKLFRIR